MDIRFQIHNSHRDNPAMFSKLDPQLRRLHAVKYQYASPIIDELPRKTGGIYSLTGGRQIGKTTLLKQWMQKLLNLGVDPNLIAYFSGELIDDHHVLLRLLQEEIQAFPHGTMGYIIVDEITYIREWDKALKYLADAGFLDKVELVITGSDAVIIQEARMRFPGRRGKANKVDFHLHPLSFREFTKLTKPHKKIVDILAIKSSEIANYSFSAGVIDTLYQAFFEYLQHGGYLTAINELADSHIISTSTLNTYVDWLRGDMLKRGKQENYLREIFQAIIKRYGCQVSWNALAKDLSIDHPQTVAEYIQFLSSMDAAFVQFALLEDKLTAAPKKARKVIFNDPFIFHAIRSWLHPVANPYQEQILTAINDVELCSHLVEACVVNHFSRNYPTYYIKAVGEVDIAYIREERFWPVEIKWTSQIRAKDLQQITKYRNGIILVKNRDFGEFNGVKTIPLPLYLLTI